MKEYFLRSDIDSYRVNKKPNGTCTVDVKLYTVWEPLTEEIPKDHQKKSLFQKVKDSLISKEHRVFFSFKGAQETVGKILFHLKYVESIVFRLHPKNIPHGTKDRTLELFVGNKVFFDDVTGLEAIVDRQHDRAVPSSGLIWGYTKRIEDGTRTATYTVTSHDEKIRINNIPEDRLRKY